MGVKPGCNCLADAFACAKHQLPAYRIQGIDFRRYCTLSWGGRLYLDRNLGAIILPLQPGWRPPAVQD